MFSPPRNTASTPTVAAGHRRTGRPDAVRGASPAPSSPLFIRQSGTAGNLRPNPSGPPRVVRWTPYAFPLTS